VKEPSLKRQCELLGVTRSVLYYKPKINEETVWLLNVIRDIWLAHPFYGYRKITVILRRDYRAEVNSKKVLRLMQWAGIQALYPKRKLSQRNPEHRVYPYLLEGMLINRVNQVWMVDITYLKLSSRFVY
jgi:putative transposase